MSRLAVPLTLDSRTCFAKFEFMGYFQFWISRGIFSVFKALGLMIAGVDIIRSKHGPLLLEVNSSPGLEGIEAATGKDIAGMMISAIEKKLNWKRELSVKRHK